MSSLERQAHPVRNALPVIITHGWPGSIIEQLVEQPELLPLSCAPHSDRCASQGRMMRATFRDRDSNSIDTAENL
jgi:hypothetical protein